MYIFLAAFLMWNLLFQCGIEEGWLGIKVFETNRSSVEKLLGNATNPNDPNVIFETKDAHFEFIFSGPPCSNLDTLMGSFSVPEGTVLQYSVRPKKSLSLGSVKFDPKLYSSAINDHIRSIVTYSNDARAIYLSTNRNEDIQSQTIRTISYKRSLESITKFQCKK